MIAVEEGRERELAEAAQQRRDQGVERRTMLTAYFEFNRKRREANQPPLHLTYDRAYRQINYNTITKEWQFYADVSNRAGRVITRMKSVSPTNFELIVGYFYMLFIYDLN